MLIIYALDVSKVGLLSESNTKWVLDSIISLLVSLTCKLNSFCFSSTTEEDLSCSVVQKEVSEKSLVVFGIGSDILSLTMMTFCHYA